MRLSILADDLTGANDSGVQLARRGLQTSVLLQFDPQTLQRSEAVVLDTDTRSLPREEAYDRVKEASQLLQEEGFDIIYKKIDSTLRGNIGVEINAVYDVFQPDFVIIAPGYPQNGRTVVEGVHYLNGMRLDETEFAHNPKDPVTEAYIPDLLRRQTERDIALINCAELRQGAGQLERKMSACHAQGVPYLVFDSYTEEDLQRVATYVQQMPYSVVWVGSAGLAHYLPDVYDLQKEALPFTIIPHNDRPVLCVVGSVSAVSRQQLQVVLGEGVLGEQHVQGLKLDSLAVISDAEKRQAEVERVLREGMQAVQNGDHLVLYSSGNPAEIEQVQHKAEELGLSTYQASLRIVEALGEVAGRFIRENALQGVIMTGGDTAKQVCTYLGSQGFDLYAELETGIPIGQLIGPNNIYAITKAGAFGNERTFITAIHKLQGKNSWENKGEDSQ